MAKEFSSTVTVQNQHGYVDKTMTIKGPLFHGGRARLRAGDLLTAGRKANGWGDEGSRSRHVYFTRNFDTAVDYARACGARGRVYEVEPTGDFTIDRNGDDFKSISPLRVVREVVL